MNTVADVQSRFSKDFPKLLPALTEKEAGWFTAFAPHILLVSCASTNRWITKKSLSIPPIVPSRASVIQSVLRTCEYRTRNAKPKTNFRSFADRVQDLRVLFQEQCTSDNAWCISEDEGTAMLKRYSDAQVKKALSELGRYDEHSQGDCLDRLAWLLAQEHFVVPVVTR
jgi:hypothetical protein